VSDASELRQQSTEQERAFQERFGYLASDVPGIWVGQYVAVNMLGGRGRDRQLAPTRASGMLEAISLDGVVLSVEDRVVFIPRESVLQVELYETRGRGSTLRLQGDTPEPTDTSDPLEDPGTIGTE
jgi:hypothetical protein